jgi:hypothetical protein
MIRYLKPISIVHLCASIFGIIGCPVIAFILAFCTTHSPYDGSPWLITTYRLLAVFTIISIIHLFGAIALLRYKEWWLDLIIFLSSIYILVFPIGTIWGLISLWVLRDKDVQKIFTGDQIMVEQYRSTIRSYKLGETKPEKYLKRISIFSIVISHLVIFGSPMLFLVMFVSVKTTSPWSYDTPVWYIWAGYMLLAFTIFGYLNLIGSIALYIKKRWGRNMVIISSSILLIIPLFIAVTAITSEVGSPELVFLPSFVFAFIFPFAIFGAIIAFPVLFNEDVRNLFPPNGN